MSIKTGNLRAIAYALRQGKDNGGIAREDLALFLQGVTDKYEALLAIRGKLAEADKYAMPDGTMYIKYIDLVAEAREMARKIDQP